MHAPLRVLCVCLLIGCTVRLPPSSAAAADPVKERLETSRRHHEWIEVDSQDGRKVRCFVVFPEVSDKATAVIVIHENKGLTDWERSVADRLAEQGYLAIAPDLLSGTGPGGGGTEAYPSRDAATKGIYSLKPQRVMEDLDAVFAQVKGMDAASGKVATVGFCWGGGQSFAYATHNPQLAAALVFYGPAPQDDEAIERIAAPVYGFYGGNDQRITGQLLEVSDSMKDASKTFDIVVYDDAGHGFFRAGEQEGATPADRKAHDEAWTRMKEILKSL
ncbi:MAG: dienelactone hydrolase family protein [Pirellulales bacterium]|nr:dienelactone hydrolase family protein [Pirellulales bacterium]